MCPTILLVEDDETVRELATDALAMLNANVIACPNADVALRELERCTPVNLVLTDIRMPGQLDGLQLAALVAERWPHLPVIVTSGNRMAGDLLPPQASFLAKPWTLEKLYQKLQALLPNEGQERES
jgi:CheY-like chemotaxis protein